MKNSILLLVFVVIAYVLCNAEAQRLRSHRQNRQRPNQQKQGSRKQANKSQRFNTKVNNQQRFNKPRQGKQGASLGSTTCDFAAHYVTDNAEFFIDRTDGLFGEDWTFDNGCENHELGCCAEDQECKCFGIIEEMDEELEEPPRCYPLRRNMPSPQFCMRKQQRGRRNRN